jgi:hypothetical protein
MLSINFIKGKHSNAAMQHTGYTSQCSCASLFLLSSGGRSVGIVRLWTKTTELVNYIVVTVWKETIKD